MVEADEGEARGQLMPLERPDLRPVGDHESHVVRPKELEDVVGEPALVAEFDRVPQLPRQLGERGGQPLVVAPESGRELPEQRAELPRG
jgi:hypothetical protein